MRWGTVDLVTRAFAVGIFVTCGALQCALGAEERVNVDHGWSDKQKGTWYTTSQGSRLIPLSWIRALEQPGLPLDGTARLFLDPDHIKKFGYLPSDSGKPESLPIGFAIDRQDDRQFSEITKRRWKSPQSKNEPWLGLTCSACHTAELTYQGKRLRIDGARRWPISRGS